MHKFRFLNILLLISIISYSQLFSQMKSMRTTNEPMHYSADVLIGSKIGDENIREYKDRVVMNQANTRITCSYAIQYFQQNRANLRGNVILTQDRLILKSQAVSYDGNTMLSYSNLPITIFDGPRILVSDSGRYYGLDKIATFSGNVVIDDDSASIFSDYIKYDRVTENSFAYGNVILKSKYSNSLLKADTIEYFPSKNYTIAKGKPALMQIDTSEHTDEAGITYKKLDTLFIYSKQMEAFQYVGNETFIFSKDVEIVRANVRARCDSAVYYKDKEIIELHRKPIVWYDSTQLHGEFVSIKMQNNKLQEIKAITKALSAFREDLTLPEFTSQITGDTITISIESNKIKTLLSSGKAKSLYFIIDENNTSDAKQNDADKIQVDFFNSQTDKVTWINNVSGSIYPWKAISTNPKQFYLPDFRWEVNLPEAKQISMKNLKNYKKIESLIFEKKSK